jgi:hypothetical protein
MCHRHLVDLFVLFVVGLFTVGFLLFGGAAEAVPPHRLEQVQD